MPIIIQDNVFKNLGPNDITTTKTRLGEAIPFTGSIFSGTYGAYPDGVVLGNEPNIKKYRHGMFESVYDYPYLSSSSNHCFDLSVGVNPRFYTTDVALNDGAAATPGAGANVKLEQTKKENIYNEIAQVMCGHDHTGGINQIPIDGNINSDIEYTVFGKDTKAKFDYFVMVSPTRLLVKDEIEKESVSITYLTGTWRGPEMLGLGGEAVTISDYNARTSYKVWPCGEVGLLYTGSNTDDDNNNPVGVVAYQAGIFLFNLSSSFSNMGHDDRWWKDAATGTPGLHTHYSGSVTPFVSASAAQPYGGAKELYWGVTGSMVSASIADISDNFRRRIGNLSFRNTTELNSQIFMCRANHNEFNYSNNPTYLDGSKIRVKNDDRRNQPVSFITTIGLYSDDNELLAVAKLSEPLKKSPSDEIICRVRLDY